MTKATKTIDADDKEAVTARYREIEAEDAAKAAQEAEQATEERKAQFAPLIEFVDSEAFKSVRERSTTLKDGFDDPLYGMLKAIGPLFDQITKQVPADARPPAEPSA